MKSYKRKTFLKIGPPHFFVISQKPKDIWKSTEQTGKFQFLHNQIKKIFTLKQHMHSKGKLEKVGLCKTEGCPCKCKITLYGQSDQACELFFNQFEHLSLCKVEPDVFKNQGLLDLCKLNLKPSEIIREFNEKEKDNGLNISDTEENRRKISTIKYLSKCDKEEEKINNINQLQAWFDEKCVENFCGEELKLLPWDRVLGGFGLVTEESQWSYETIFRFLKELFEKCFQEVSIYLFIIY